MPLCEPLDAFPTVRRALVDRAPLMALSARVAFATRSSLCLQAKVAY